MLNTFKMRDENGTESTPFDGETLIACAHQGIIQPATMICDLTAGRWMPAAEHPLLGGSGAPSPSSASPPPPPPAAPYVASTQATQKGPSAALACVAGLAAFLVVFFLLSSLKKHSGSVDVSPSHVRTVATTDGRYGINIPQDWIRSKTKRDTLVEYTTADKRTGVLVLKVMQATTTATGLSAMMNGAISRETEYRNGSPIGDPKPITVNGFPGYQQDIQEGGLLQTGEFRLTILRAPDGVYSLVAFVDQSAGLKLSDLDGVTKSFHRLPASYASPSPK